MDWVGQFEVIMRDSPLLALVLAFVGGVLAGFTPCSYPMLPIVVGFVGSKARGSRLRGFVLSSFYVLGVAIVYSSLGAFAALSGRMFGTIASNPWVYLLVGNICIAFGLVMLDAVALPSPAFLSRFQVRHIPGHDIITSILLGGASVAHCAGRVNGLRAPPGTAITAVPDERHPLTPRDGCRQSRGCCGAPPVTPPAIDATRGTAHTTAPREHE